MKPHDEYVLTDDGVRLFARVFGDGQQTVVLPNGTYLIDDFDYLADGRTVVFYDVRNRGCSDAVADEAKLTGGIHRDVDDLDLVRRHFGVERIDLIGHSYIGMTVILYAMKYRAHVGRVIQLGPIEPRIGKQYPPHLTGADDVLRECLARIAQLEQERGSSEPEEFCRKVWSILRMIYVSNPADADKIRWARCDLPNERNAMKYWTQYLLPSMRSVDLSEGKLGQVDVPVLTIHGTRDRSAPYGGAREWAMLLPGARLITVKEAAHAPWIEAPGTVFDSVETFLDGRWPEAAERVTSL